MIEHRQDIAIDAPNPQVWTYVSNMANWAANMPGYKAFDMLSEKESLWTLKVGVGALNRTVKVRVHITAWNEPDHVAFTFKLDNDPVDGNGAYRALVRADGGTDVDIGFCINGQGPMAGAWEAMMRPILPKMTQGFGNTLKARIEELSAQQPRASIPAPAAAPAPVAGRLARLWHWILNLTQRRHA